MSLDAPVEIVSRVARRGGGKAVVDYGVESPVKSGDESPHSTGLRPFLAALPALRVRGRDLVDPSGRTVLLKGANLGNWLVIEFWMLALDGKTPRDQFELEAILARRFGEAEKERLMDAYRASWITERDLRILPTFGFNCVRLPLNYRLMEDDRRPFQLKKDAWKWVDRAVDMAERSGLYTILDMHGVQGGQNVNDHTGHAGQNHIKDSPEDQKRLAWLWGEVAKRYAKRSAVVAYDVWNEPYDTPQSLYKPIFESALRAIRAVDPDKLVYAMGHYSGFSAYGDPRANGWKNVGFEMHYYPGLFGGGDPTVRTQQKHLASLSDVQKEVERLDAPFLVGEMNVVFDAAGGADMMRRTYDRHARLGWATTMWSLKLQTREGGIGSSFWGMESNAKPAAQIDFSTSSRAEIEGYFRHFATQPLVVNEPLRKALGDPAYVPRPLPEAPAGRTTAPQESLEGWTQTDVGGALKGGLSKAGEAFSLFGGGRDVWGSRDEFRFLHRAATGDFSLSVVIRDIEDLDAYTKAGLMVRASEAPDAPFVLLSSFPSGEVQLAHRDAPGVDVSAPPTAMSGGSHELHLLLCREGGRFTAFYLHVSGVYKEFASVPDVLSKTVLVGPIACSHDASALVKVDYRDLRLMP